MFESLPDLASLAAADDATVVAAIEAGARAEAASAAVRLAAIAELVARRCGDEDDPRALWACDLWDSAAAEVAAAQGISHRRASNQMHLAGGLRDRLPQTAALLAQGAISAPTASTIAWRTHLVEDTEAMAAIDAQIAKSASQWGPLSDTVLNQSIDAVLDEHDPDARVQFHSAARNRDVQFGKPEDSTGTASMWGRLLKTDATLFDRRIAAIIGTLCHDDPRTMGERRSDAMGAIAAGVDTLACRCGNPDCAGAGIDSRAGAVMIYVIADEEAVRAAREDLAAQAQHAARNGQEGEPAAAPDADREEAGEPAASPPVSPEAEPEPKPEADPAAPTRRSAKKYRTALIRGGGVVPTPLLAELIRNGATISPLREPSPIDEASYRPSRKLDEFVRARDLTCRFPGCNAPAEYCDVDHTIAHPDGSTHPSNLKCLCRKHHLLKTFWTGPDGWTDQQHPDGTITWTSPSGRTYTTYPGSRILFPQWDITTAPLPPPEGDATGSYNRGLMMPQRRRTRAADRRQRQKADRALNGPPGF